MNEEVKETLSIDQLVQSLIGAAKNEEWEKVDEKLVPRLEEVDRSKVAQRLLSYVDDKDPNVRDVVATSLAALRISDEEVRKRAIDGMMTMATEDEAMFPAGRAAVFLLRHQHDEGFEDQIESALSVFKDRVREKGWRSVLSINIPRLRKFFSESE